MFDEFSFDKLDILPEYIFSYIANIKLEQRRKGKDIIDFSMGNPDGSAPSKVINKLIEASKKKDVHGYCPSNGIVSLRKAICKRYLDKYGVKLDYKNEAVFSIGSKEGYINLIQAIVNKGDTAIVTDPYYPIHSYAFKLVGANVSHIKMKYNDEYELDEDDFFRQLYDIFKFSSSKPKFLTVNFPNNPTTVTISDDFYKNLVKEAKKLEFYIISDLAYSDLTFNDYKTPSILSVEGAKDLAVESFSMSKSYNMAGWRVGFFLGNKRLIQSLVKLKTWLDYGLFTPIQIAATVALNDGDDIVKENISKYQNRLDVLIKSFKRFGWDIKPPKATMFVWAKLPSVLQDLSSIEFCEKMLLKAGVAFSPGSAFGKNGEGYVRIALIENEKRIRQAGINIRDFLKNYE